MDTEDVTAKTLAIRGNLEISDIDIPEIPKDIIFPDELNRYLREQIRYYVHENGMLQKNLSDLETRFDNSKAKTKDLENRLNFYEKSENKNYFTSNQVASQRIVELSKKLREKTAEVESCKHRLSKLERHIFDLRKKVDEHCECTDPENQEKQDKPEESELEQQVKKLQEKLTGTTNKMIETRNLNMQLKNDLKLSNKLLQQEVGESFENIQSLNNTNKGGWRGRAQVICDLQQKNNELKEKLKSFSEKSNSSEGSLPSRMESKVSILSQENKDLTSKCEDLRKKYEALRARFRVLDTEYTLTKSKLSMTKEQSERDQDLIATLSSELANSRGVQNDMLKQKDLLISKMHQEAAALTKEIDEYKAVVRKLRKELEDKEKELENAAANILGPCSASRPNNADIENAKQFEAERQKLLDLISEHNNRLTAERDAHAKTQNMLRLEKQRAAKAEANAARLELDSNTARSSYSSISIRPLDHSLKDQLELAEENLKALRTRLEIEQFERKTDLDEFSKILQSCERLKEDTPTSST